MDDPLPSDHSHEAGEPRLAGRWRIVLEQYEAGRHAASLRVPLAGLTPAAVHERLIQAGFWPLRLPVHASTDRGGGRRWRLRPEGAGVASLATVPMGDDVPRLAAQHAYVHPDGGVVRTFSDTGPLEGLVVRPGPWARKSALLALPESRMPPDLSLDREAFVVTDEGNPLPKSPRVAHGLKFDVEQPDSSYALARAIVVGSRIPLLEGPVPPTALRPAILGLAKSWTLVPVGDFWEIADEIERVAEHQPVLFRKEAGDLRLFFTGDEGLRIRLLAEVPRTALGSLFINRGSCVIGVEPFGYEASVEHLAEFCGPLLEQGWRVFDDVTGADLTLIAERFPRRLFDADARIDTSVDPATL